jgi:hypothetical protein
MEHTPHTVIKTAIRHCVSVNLTLISGDVISILPSRIIEDGVDGGASSGWYVLDVFGGRVHSNEIVKAHIGFIGMEFDKK